MKIGKIKVTRIVAGCLLLPTVTFVAYKLDKWEIMPARHWRATYEQATPKGTMYFIRRSLLLGDADAYAASFQLTEQDDVLLQSFKQMGSCVCQTPSAAHPDLWRGDFSNAGALTAATNAPGLRGHKVDSVRNPGTTS
jgi:hypothetical protein